MKSSVGTKLHKQMARFVCSYSNRTNECDMNECIILCMIDFVQYPTLVSEVRLEPIRTSTTEHFCGTQKSSILDVPLDSN